MFYSNNSTLYIRISVLLIKIYCCIFSDDTQCCFMVPKPRVWSLIKKMRNFSMASHKTMKRFCGRNPYDRNHECLEQLNLPYFKIFIPKNQVQFTFRLLLFQSSCVGNHKLYLRYGYLFCKYKRSYFLLAIRLLMLLIIQ